MIKAITDRMILWVLAIALLWALLAQPAFIKLGDEFQSKYHPANGTLCPTDKESSSC